MNSITKVNSGAPWEEIVGYSRAIKVGNTIEVSGTTAPGADAYEQAVGIIKIAEKALEQLGASLDHVVRTRMYCTDITKWEGIGKAHREFFGHTKPATSLVEVSKLIAPEILVEIEFTAIV